MLTIPGTNFELVDVFDALWYLPQWYDRLSAWEADTTEGKLNPKPTPEQLDPPPKVKTLAPNEVKEEASSPSPIFALTIGIDNYLNHGPIFSNMTGCVADADDIVDFLTSILRVPHDHLTNLRNEEATADGITAAFESLAGDVRIPEGANIFIYYAGHGSEALPPVGWPSNGQIQTLVPYDFDPGSSVDLTTKNGLADIKISQLLENIANAKGNNITVIFDSCHSGSGTRHAGSLEEVISIAARGVELPEGTRLGIDALPVSRGSTVLQKDKNKGLASHVFLAACAEQQLAFESSGRGAFTCALTKLLRSEDLRQLTYSDLIRRLPQLPCQNPQCEGVNKDLIFLNNYTAGSRRISYNVTENASNGDYKIDAGEAHGVTVEAEFAVYSSTVPSEELGRLVVHKTDAFQSYLRPLIMTDDMSFRIPETGAFALQTRIGILHDVRLLIELDAGLAGVLTAVGQQMLTTSAFKPSIKVVTTREENPDLIVTARGGTAHFEITDQICCDAGLHEIYHRPETDKNTMTRVLRGVADFYWHLHRKPQLKEKTISTKINLECYELVTVEIDNNLLPVMKPTGNDLLVNGAIQIGISDDQKPYGFRINNACNIPLFVSVFYFNMSDLSIDSYYQPPSAGHGGHVESLPPNSFLTIGYGTGGSPPYSFYLDEGQEVDVGYIKLFISTEYVDYSSIPQRSPFLREGRGSKPKLKPRSQLWDTMLIPIIQRMIKM